ncbi:MAG: DUF547 domain-containing protein [Verrucomicrobiota bacterium]
MRLLSTISLKLAVGALTAVASAPYVHAASVDNSTWAHILEASVSEDGWVDYQEIKKDWNKELLDYLSSLESVNIKELSSDDHRMAFWINAYNAITIQVLLDEGLPEKVPHARFFGKNIFKQKDYRIAGKVRSLDEIEHDILRPRHKDPRIHAALVCGASSCPRLRPEPYRGDKLDEQLTEEAERWVQKGRNKAGRRKNRLDKGKGVYYVSEIFKWFNEDFYGGGKNGVLKFLEKFGNKDNHRYLEKREVEIEYLDYDWTLNDREE